MALFDVKKLSGYLCPRCNGQMDILARPINATYLQCRDCESLLSVDYVQGWNEARVFYCGTKPTGAAIASTNNK